MIFYPAAYAGKAHPGISGMFTAQKKEWSHTGFHSLLRVALPQINFLSPASLSENKKVPKDCHAASEKSSVLPDDRTAPDTKYNHKQRMHPGPSLQGGTGTCGLRKAGRHIGYVLPLPVPHNRSRIKINYGFILAQYLVRCAFEQAVKWEIIARNPFPHANKPKTNYKKRDIWTADMIRKALDECDDMKLYVAMNLAFACSMRYGEICGLTWDKVHISDEDIANDDSHLWIEQELARVSREARQQLDDKDIMFIFPSVMSNTHTNLVLKKPKTESSIRKVWIPKTVAYILREWRQIQDQYKEYLGQDFYDYNLVLTLPNGRPVENRIMEKEFSKLREKAGLPYVVFHSLRHSSTTYKLKLNHGDLKATQGDTGHAQIDMITDVYAHILDEDRKVNAQKFEATFYAKNPVNPLRDVKPPEETGTDLTNLIAALEQSPELVAMLTQALKGKAISS